MTVFAAWELQCKAIGSAQATPHIKFRRDVVIGLTKGTSRSRLGGPTAHVSAGVGYDGFEYYLESTTQERSAECHKKTIRNSAPSARKDCTNHAFSCSIFANELQLSYRSMDCIVFVLFDSILFRLSMPALIPT